MVTSVKNCDVLLAGYDAIRDGILISDSNLSLLFFNQTVKDLFHLDDSALHKQHSEIVSAFILQGIKIEPFLALLEDIKNNPQLERSLEFSCSAGKKRLNTRPLHANNGNILGRIWIISDISREILKSIDSEHEEELFKTIFNLIPEGIAISDLITGHFLEVNKNFTEHWGFTREEVIGKSAIDLGFWVDLTQRQHIVDLMENQGSFTLVPVKMRGKDKTVKDILLSGVMVTVNNRSYMLSIPLDITDIITYEKKIWSLASFIELNPNPIFEINMEGAISFYNNATVSIIQKLTNTTDISLFIPSDLEEILQAIKLGAEASFHREFLLSGRYFYENIYITKDYRTARVYVTDITERKLAEFELLKKNEELGSAYEEILSAEEELRQNYERLLIQEYNLNENEKKLRMIVDHIPGIVTTTDTNMVVKSVYGEGLIHMGHSPNEGAGQRLEELFYPMDNILIDAHYRALKGMVSTVEGSFENRKFVLFTSPLRDLTDDITGTMGVAIDITDQKNLEDERKRLLQQLEQNLIELALLNDKIRNPLTVISTLVEMYAPEIEEAITTCVQEIDDIIINLDKRWDESEKTVSFLQKHYGIGFNLK